MKQEEYVEKLEKLYEIAVEQRDVRTALEVLEQLNSHKK